MTLFHLRTAWLFLGILFISFSSFGQQSRSAKGRVVDVKGIPLIGVTVSNQNKSVNTSTDSMGNFLISPIFKDELLLFSMIGHVVVEQAAVLDKPMVITLLSNTQMLDDVVIIGYGTTTKRDLTGAVGQANLTDMRKAPVANFEEALAGRVAGVQVSSNDGQPGAELKIVIRGNNSVTQDNSPLYVVDGFPVETSVGNMINPEEIASLEVLKDASATAIYGARGANGVVLITTKKGKVGAPVINYSGWVGLNQVIKKQEVLDPYEFVKYQLEQNPVLYTGIYLKEGKKLDDYRDMEGINWQDKIFRNAVTHNHTLAMRGGSELTRYAISGSALDQDGIILNSGFNKYQGRIVLDQTINTKFKAGINLNYTAYKRYGTVVSESQVSPTASLMYGIWGFRPVTGSDLADASLIDDLFDPDMDPSAGTDLRINPYLAVQNEYNPLFSTNLTANGYLEYKLAKTLTWRTTGGYTRINQRREVFFNSRSRGGHPYTNNKVNGSIWNNEITNLLNENTLSYDKKFKGGHRLSAVAGFTLQDIRNYTNGFSSILVPNEALGIKGLDEGQVTTAPITDQANGLVSYLGRVDYNYRSRYLLTLSFRSDGSSKFPKANRWAYFPSGSFAWRLKEENFLKSLTVINDAKIRVGIGSTGNNRVSDYASLSALQMNPASGYSIGNSAGQGMVPTNLGNPNLKWETTVQTNVGLDVSLFKNRVSLTTDYYHKETRDLLLNATLAPSMGFLTGFKNIGRVSNSGIEFTLETKNVQTPNFSWNSSFNIAFNKNKVLELNEGEPSLATRVTWGNFNNAYPYIAIPGQPIALFYGYLFDGVYQYADFDEANGSYILKTGVPNNGVPRANIEPGDIRFKDINGDGQVDNYDLTIIGNPNPKHIGGFNNNFIYKNFDLNVFLQWSYGGDILNANRIEFEGGDPVARGFLNMFASFADRWTPENQTNDLYRVGGQGPAVYSSRTIEDGSYLRLKTVSLGYTFDAKQLKRIRMSSIRVYMAAQNLITWTNYSGLDPEVNTRPGALTPSFDWSAYPRPRTVTLGLDLNF
ncbi:MULTISPECIES: SusC/RagA family TonB-linked outer membrane protein [Sphingobacterium]|uniref:SusC/RagA family TonB-linked outer membrane protein n=1 Tax=Sphingobacterium TaxID=28453 RepID=UPI001046C540|nr:MULTISPECIES: TonB-dependent receptor [Sphingobacterium]MCW2263965.1 TonB-linked SusC/RagA family outer membrane protein [Sphingobacterium kitahiroshimense]TCR01715.1 TonB-linked SusC/RagA family outer membrane protein [Sphingobacterium sp. JUb78]